MSVCAVILAGLQGKYAFYAAMPVALTFGKKFKNFILLYSVDVRVYANHKVFLLEQLFHLHLYWQTWFASAEKIARLRFKIPYDWTVIVHFFQQMQTKSVQQRQQQNKR